MKPPLIITVLCLLLTIGCATATMSTGRDFDTTRVTQIAKGETTRDQLIAWFGQPYSKTVGDGSEQLLWLYTNTESKARSYVVTMKVNTQMTGKRLSVTIKSGVVTDYAFTDGPMDPTSYLQP